MAANGPARPDVIAVPPVRADVPETVATADAPTVNAPPAVGETVSGVTQSDVIGWSVRGLTDDVIVDRIAHGGSAFHLSAGEEMTLRDAGVSDDVIRAMKATAWN